MRRACAATGSAAGQVSHRRGAWRTHLADRDARSCRDECVPRYGFRMPPCFDVYTWIRTDDRPAILSRFVERYVDRADPGDPRFDAFLRTFVAETPSPGDTEALADLRRDADAKAAFSLYLRAERFHGAIVTLTEEGDIVLGLSLDDPLNDPDIERQASTVLARLMDEFDGSAGIGGVELAPPQSIREWVEDALVVLRVGSV